MSVDRCSGIYVRMRMQSRLSMRRENASAVGALRQPKPHRAVCELPPENPVWRNARPRSSKHAPHRVIARPEVAWFWTFDKAATVMFRRASSGIAPHWIFRRQFAHCPMWLWLTRTFPAEASSRRILNRDCIRIRTRLPEHLSTDIFAPRAPLASWVHDRQNARGQLP